MSSGEEMYQFSLLFEIVVNTDVEAIDLYGQDLLFFSASSCYHHYFIYL